MFKLGTLPQLQQLQWQTIAMIKGICMLTRPILLPLKSLTRVTTLARSSLLLKAGNVTESCCLGFQGLDGHDPVGLVCNFL